MLTMKGKISDVYVFVHLSVLLWRRQIPASYGPTDVGAIPGARAVNIKQRCANRRPTCPAQQAKNLFSVRWCWLLFSPQQAGPHTSPPDTSQQQYLPASSSHPIVLARIKLQCRLRTHIAWVMLANGLDSVPTISAPPNSPVVSLTTGPASISGSGVRWRERAGL